MTLTELEKNQKEVVASLRRAVSRNRLPHGLIFSSSGNVGEEETALRLAQFLLCENPKAELEFCGECSNCHLFQTGNHPDFYKIKPKGLMRAIKTSDIYNLIQSLRTTSMTGIGKVVIIFNAESLNKESANRLLKTLEEPTSNTYFILLTSRLERLIQTIKSRCQIIRFKPAVGEDLKQRIENELGIKGGDLEIVSSVSRGRWTRALYLFNNLSEYKEIISAISIILLNRNSAASKAVEFASRIAKSKKEERAAFDASSKKQLSEKTKELKDLETKIRREMLDELEQQLKSEQAAKERDKVAGIFEAMIDLWRDVLVYKQTNSGKLLLHKFLEKNISELAEKYSEAEIVRNLADIDLVRGPTVFLNTKIDIMLQGLFAQAASKSKSFVPLRAAILAKGL